MSKQEEFINVIAKLARKEYLARDRWVLPSVCIAQACLESGFNLNASTLFGIKGCGVSTPTQEYINGEWITITDSFEYFPNLEAAVSGYYDFLANNSLYEYVINQPDYKKAVHGLQHTTQPPLAYATAPNYEECVISIIEQYNLTIFDTRSYLESNKSDEVAFTVRYTKESPSAFSTSEYGSYKCVADILNVRDGAGTGKPIMISIFDGTPVLCSGFYSEADNMKWLLIQFYGRDNKVYCGYASSTYLERI